MAVPTDNPRQHRVFWKPLLACPHRHPAVRCGRACRRRVAHRGVVDGSNRHGSRYHSAMMRWVVVILCALVLLGCTGPNVVGKWEYQLFGQAIVLDLKEDNTFTMGSSSTSAQAGSYTYEEGKVKLNFGSSENEN